MVVFFNRAVGGGGGDCFISWFNMYNNSRRGRNQKRNTIIPLWAFQHTFTSERLRQEVTSITDNLVLGNITDNLVQKKKRSAITHTQYAVGEIYYNIILYCCSSTLLLFIRLQHVVKRATKTTPITPHEWPKPAPPQPPSPTLKRNAEKITENPAEAR